MTRKETRYVRSFPATGPDGREHTIDVHQLFIHTRSLSGSAVTPGIESLSTDGEHVNRRAKGEYEVPAWGLRLRSDHTDAF